ncbi:MAG: glycoside hydrolase family 28 protein [Maritimibacter sp.]
MIASRDICITPDGIEATTRIQAAIDSTTHQRLRVVLAPGRHICGGLTLRSNVELHLDEGAELVFIPDYAAYEKTRVGVIAEESDRAMITGKGAQNIAITGTGRISCDGSRAFSLGSDDAMGTLIPAEKRPRVLVLEDCQHVALTGITVLDSPMWTLHFVGCSDVSLRGIRVDNNRQMPNTDGIVVDGCQNLVVSDSEIRTADDGIVLKTSATAEGGTAGECRDIRVTGCTIESRSCALKIGTESHDNFRDISFEDCEIVQSNRGLGIFSRDGGVVENVRFARIKLDCHETPDGFWGSGEALTINVIDRRPDSRPAGAVRGVEISEISGHMQGAINLFAERAGDISDVLVDGLSLKQRPGTLGTAQSYDLRPTAADLEADPNAEGRANAWRKGADGRVIGLVEYPGGMPAIFARNVAGLDLQNWQVSRPDPLPDGWNSEALVTL